MGFYSQLGGTGGGGGNVSTVGGVTGYFPNWTGPNTLAAQTLLFGNATGVAIGSTSPTHRFQVTQQANLTADSLLKISSFLASSIFQIDIDASNFASVTANVYEKPFLINVIGSGGRFKLATQSSIDSFEFSPVASGEFTFTTGSNPGIDINNPSSGVMNKYTAMLGTASGNVWYVAAERTDVGSAGTDVATIYGKLIQKAGFNNTNAIFYPAVFMDGNVGIGTKTPAALLEVSGLVKVNTINLNGNTASTIPYINSSKDIISLTIGSGLSLSSGTLSATGGSGITRSISSVSTATAAGATAATDYVYFVSGTTTITLPTAVGNTNRYALVHTDTSTMTIATTSSQTIAFYPSAPATTATVTVQGTVTELYSDGANWWTI